MSIRHINRLQEEADSAYNRVPQSEAAAWAQVIAQCEIAQQLARIATQLEDGQIALLEGGTIVQISILANNKKPLETSVKGTLNGSSQGFSLMR